VILRRVRIDAQEKIPTVYEWGGGAAVFELWFDVFYACVGRDELLGPMFGAR
jgi:truncated hemoglobin YjbI